MSDTSTPSTRIRNGERRRSRRRQRVALAVGLLALATACLYLFVNSSLFFTMWLQPRMEQALGGPIEYSYLSWSPWGHVTLRNLRLTPLPGEDFNRLRIKEVDCRFRGASFLAGRPHITALFVDSPEAYFTRGTAGAMTGPFCHVPSAGQAESKPGGPAADGAAPKKRAGLPDLGDVRVKALRVRLEMLRDAGTEPASIELTELSASAPRLAPGVEWRLEAGGKVQLRVPGGASTELEGALGAELTGTPGAGGDRTAGSLHISKISGVLQGRAIEAAELSANAGAAGGPATGAVAFRLGGREVALIRLDPAEDATGKRHGLRLRLEPVAAEALNLIAPPALQADCTSARLSGDATLWLESASRIETVDAQAALADFAPKASFLSTPPEPVNAHASIRLTRRADGAFYVEALRAEVLRADGDKALLAESDEPFPLAGGLAALAEGRGEGGLTIGLRRFDVAPWRCLSPIGRVGPLSAGVLEAYVHLGTRPQGEPGRELRVLARGAGVAGRAGVWDFGPAAMEARVVALGGSGRGLTMETAELNVATPKGQVGKLTLRGAWGNATNEGDWTLEFDNLDLAPLALVRRPAPERSSPVAITTGRVSGTLGLKRETAGEAALRARANIQVAELTLLKGDVPQRRKLGPMHVTLAGETVRRGGQRATALGMHKAGLRAVMCEPSESSTNTLVSIQADGELLLEKGAGRLDARADYVDLGLLVDWMERLPRSLRPRTGAVRANFQISLAGARRLATQGEWHVNPLRFRLPGNRGEFDLPVSGTLDQVYDMDSRQLDIRALDLLVASPGSQAPGNIHAEGRIAFGALPQGSLDVRIEDVCPLPFGPLLPSFARKVDLADAIVGGQEQIVVGGRKGLFEMQGVLILAKLHPATAATPAPPDLGVLVQNTLIYQPPNLLLENFDAELTYVGEESDRLRLSGAVRLDRLSESEVKFNAEELHMRRLLAFSRRPLPADASPLLLESTKGKVQWQPARGVFHLRDLETKIDGGKLTCGQMTIANAPSGAFVFEWQDLRGKKIPVEVLAPYVPGLRDVPLAGQMDFETAGQTAPGAWPPVRGKFHGMARKGSLGELPVLRALAGAIGIEAMLPLAFDELEADLVTVDDALLINVVDLKSPVIRLRTDGRIEQDGRIDLPMRVSLAGDAQSLAAKTRYGRYLRDDADGFRVFAAPFAVKGTFARPQIRFDAPIDTRGGR